MAPHHAKRIEMLGLSACNPAFHCRSGSLGFQGGMDVVIVLEFDISLISLVKAASSLAIASRLELVLLFEYPRIQMDVCVCVGYERCCKGCVPN